MRRLVTSIWTTKDNSLTYENRSGRKVYQSHFWKFLGRFDSYRDGCGKQPVASRWSLENFSERDLDIVHSERKQTLETIRSSEQERFLLMPMILDLYWISAKSCSKERSEISLGTR